MNLHSLLGFLLYYSCLPWIKLPQVLSFYFHDPAPDAFERIIRWAIKKGYQFVSLQDLVNYIDGKEQPKERWAVVTFDDAWQSNRQLLPIIERYQIPVTIFAPVTPLTEGNYWWEYAQHHGGITLSNQLKDYPEAQFREAVSQLVTPLSRSAMTIEELQQINQHPLVDIQSHSYTHPILTQLSDSSLKKELCESQQQLQQLLNKEVRFFSYPNGSISPREKHATAQYYDAACSTRQAAPIIGDDRYDIPRYALTNDYWSNLAKLIGVWHLLKRK